MSKKKEENKISLEDIPEDNPLYEQIQKYLATQKQGDTFASIAKDDNDDIKSYEQVDKKELIFIVDNTELQRKDEPWKILQRYLLNNLYYPGESYKTRTYYETILSSTGSVEFQHFSGFYAEANVYNFSKMIVKHIITIEEWGLSSMKERQIELIDQPEEVILLDDDPTNHFILLLPSNSDFCLEKTHFWF